jgi:hypothetical protein
MTKPNPIRILRGLLRTEDDPLTQAAFAKLTDIPVDSIRNFEIERRALTPPYLRRIADTIGAQWDPERGLWHLVYSPEIPYTAAIFEMFTTRLLDSRIRRRVEIHMLLRRLIELFLQVEPDDYQRLFYRVFHFLDDIREELRISGARKTFEKTRFSVNAAIPDKSLGVGTLARNYNHMTDDELVLMEGKGRERQGRWWDFSFLDKQLPDVEGT